MARYYRKRYSRKVYAKPPMRNLDTRPRNRYYGYVMNAVSKVAGTKFYFNSVNTSVSTTATISQLSGLSLGNTDITRIGDEIVPKSLTYSILTSCSDNTNIIRLIIFQWNENTTPVASDIWESTSTAQDQYMGPIRGDNLRRNNLRIISDHRFVMVSTQNNALVMTRPIRKSLRKCGKICYMAGGTTGHGNIWYAVCSDSSAVNHPGFAMNWKLSYLNI